MSDRLRYEPALDGLRGVSVAAVLLFHAEVSWARGGYLGVSTFFTLSGFLITTLLLREHAETGTVSMRGFYERRVRRLAPALAVTVGAALLYGATVADATVVRDLRGDALAAIGYVANWRFALGEQSYSDLFSSPSPLLHLWSISIEEQFYLLFPPAFAFAATRLARRGSDPTVAVAAATAIAAAVLVASGVAGADHDLIYFGTHTRASELLIGALLAALVHRGTLRAATEHLTWAGPAALAGLCVAWATLEQGDAVLDHGGFTAYAVLSATVVLAATTSGNAVHAALRVEPLRTLGRISYGVYLYHWPIYQWLTPARTDLDQIPLLAARTTATIAAALLTYHLIEQPIRNRTLLRTPRHAIGATAATIALLLTTTIATTTNPPTDDLQDAEQAARLDPNLSPPNPEGVDAIRVAVFGDSAALVTGVALDSWMNGPGFNVLLQQDLGAPGVIGVRGSAVFHCGILGDTPTRLEGKDFERVAACDAWRDEWTLAVEGNDPDVAVVQLGLWEVVDRILPGDDTHRAPGDPVFDAALRAAVEEATDLLVEHGLIVLWILSPHIDTGTVEGARPATSHPESDPARIDRLNAIIGAVAAERPGVVGTIDLPGYLASLPGGEMDTTLRPDLVHFANDAASTVAEQWLGPEILRAYAEVTGCEVPS